MKEAIGQLSKLEITREGKAGTEETSPDTE